MLHDKMIGFFGAGSLTTALVQGLIQAGLVTGEQLLVTNRSDAGRLRALAERWGVQATASRRAVAAESDILVVACKPKDVAELLAEVGAVIRPGSLVLSVAAGISTAALAARLCDGVQVVRAMPNTSAVVGASATAYCYGPGASPAAVAQARMILGAVGKVVELPENLLDAVTGLSGSGPAYVYYMIEALIEAGKRVGLQEEVAADLARQTLLGAARMLVETGEEPAVLRQRVTSPGGTTMAGIQELDARGFTEAVIAAVARATARARELGAELTAAEPSVAARPDKT